MSKTKQIRDRIKDFRRVKASELFASPRNWREHPEAQQAALRGVLEEVGYADALLARELPDGSLEFVDGHLRKETTPDQEVPVLILDIDEDEAKKLLAVIDPLAAMAEANTDALGQLLAEIGTESPGLQAMLDDLASENGIDLFADGAEDLVEPEPQIDRAAELQKEWGTETGQLWVIPGKAGEHRLLCGDSTKAEDVGRVMGGEAGACVIADPPYGVSFCRGQYITDKGRVSTSNVPKTIEGDELRGADQREFIATVFRQAVAVCDAASPVYMWSAPLAEGCESFFGLVEAGCHIQSQLVWEKNNHVLGQADHHWKHEICWYGWLKGKSHQWHGGRDKFSIIKCARVQATLHPNEKPAGLALGFLENSTREGDIVYDPFLGSGTTMVAAENLSRICYGIEIDPPYCGVILQRMKDMGLEPRLEGTTQ